MLLSCFVPTDLDDGGEVFDTSITHELVETANCILFEMGSGTVGVERFSVLVLLIDKDGIGVIFDPMGNVGDATGLLARCCSQFLKDFGNLRAVFVGEAHANCEGDHGFKGSRKKVR